MALCRTALRASTDAPLPLLLQLATTMMYAAAICCPMEERLISSILRQLPGVAHLHVAVVSKTVTVTHDPCLASPAVLLAALNSAGMQASIGGRRTASAAQVRLPPWHMLLSALLALLALLALASPATRTYTQACALSAVALGLPPFLPKAWASARTRTLDITVLLLLAVLGAAALGDRVEAAAILVLFSIAEWLEGRCLSRAHDALTSVLELQPDTALCADTKQQMPIARVTIGQRLLVRPGDKVPVDGQVVAGQSLVDESMLTGESRAVGKVAGSAVLAGTLNCGVAVLEVRCTAPASDSTVSKLAALIGTASAQKSRSELMVERCARAYTPVVVAAAALLAPVPSVLGWGPWRPWVYLALVVLVTSCPCALVISTPVTSLCGIARAARQGVLIKGGR